MAEQLNMRQKLAKLSYEHLGSSMTESILYENQRLAGMKHPFKKLSEASRQWHFDLVDKMFAEIGKAMEKW